ncbi:cation:proton antiporter [Methylobacterium thuringiense]|uniref:Sodium, potassium, lithium and rubidium/H(+) antiporter n=1 Tax=Methylobacterium thuringiense TaxID=1003091 RepID=A0ABQ4TQJ2_9HYPH|nr:sodium:proton antiporter [Methylobacterium thuringiense]GJE56886.1 Sodium, potassium, lithium and rubidium/H(+) antiporter [Methylobacterium thuringiense]
MFVFEWIVAVLVGAVLLAALARRVGAPYPAFLALGGVGLALAPGFPNLRLDPDLALALFLAPVLVDAGYATSLRDLRVNWRPIAGLAVGAVLVTTLAVAVVVKMLVPDMPLSAAIVLGAIVAPPDAVAALSVLAHVPLPHRLTTILRGESLLNDAGSLLIYRLGVAAAVTGHFSLSEVAPAFLLGVVGSLIAGPILARIYLWGMRWVSDPASSIVLQFAAAFGVWIAAEAIELSGVLTVVSFALVVARYAPERTAPRPRILSYAVWDTVIFVLNVLAFVLIGNQLGPILERLRAAENLPFAMVAGSVLLTVVLVRIAWVLPASGIRRIGFAEARRSKDRSVLDLGNAFRKGIAAGGREASDLGPGAGFAVSWAGMRGLVTIAGALALPESGPNGAFPYRDLIVLTAFAVVIGTLVIQGLTLRPLLAWLKLEDTDPVGHEVGWGRAEAYGAAIESLEGDESEIAEALRREFRLVVEEAEAHEEGLAPEGLPADDARRRAIQAARERILALRRAGEIGDDAFFVLEEEFDWTELSATPRAET